MAPDQVRGATYAYVPGPPRDPETTTHTPNPTPDQVRGAGHTYVPGPPRDPETTKHTPRAPPAQARSADRPMKVHRLHHRSFTLFRAFT